MVAHVVNVVAINGVLDFQPHLLVKHQHSDVVEERRHVRRAESIVAAARDQDGVIAGQVGHRVAEAGDWGLALYLELNKLTVHNFSVNYNGLEVAELILQLSLLIFATKIIDAFLD